MSTSKSNSGLMNMLAGAVKALGTAMGAPSKTWETMNTIKDVGVQAATKIETIEKSNKELGFMLKRYGTCMFKNEYFDEDMHRPFLLACGHVICQSCLGKSLRDERTGAKLFSAKCPLCKGPSQYSFYVPFFIIAPDVLAKLQVQMEEIPAHEVDDPEIAQFIPLGDRAVQIASEFVMMEGLGLGRERIGYTKEKKASKKSVKFGKSKRLSRKKK